MEPISIFWFRRDLRLHDNAGLFHALKENERVQPIFIFDKSILEELPENDARVDFIYQSLEKIQSELNEIGCSLLVLHDHPLNAFHTLTDRYTIKNVITNHDYEPYAQKRDKEIEAYLLSKQIQFKTYKDQVIFEKNEIVKDDQTPYTVYTPYSKRWKAALKDENLASFPSESYFDHFEKSSYSMPALDDIGFKKSQQTFPLSDTVSSIIDHYHETRDIPSLEGTSRLGIHLRFGTISIRKLTRFALKHNEKYLNELIWREFYQSILWHFPHIIHSSFKPQYDEIKWRNNELEFIAWCEGQTGYPIVDAGMRELNQTGWMHNRVRMITASFLTKHLLIDWRWGEAYFAKKLIDFDLASNNGGWQWAAGCGVDAAPYFRIFNPYLQTEKFDGQKIYIRKWVPEFESNSYPSPIVDHTMARERCLEVYKHALKKEV